MWGLPWAVLGVVVFNDGAWGGIEVYAFCEHIVTGDSVGIFAMDGNVAADDTVGDCDSLAVLNFDFGAEEAAVVDEHCVTNVDRMQCALLVVVYEPICDGPV